MTLKVYKDLEPINYFLGNWHYLQITIDLNQNHHYMMSYFISIVLISREREKVLF